MHIRLSDIRRVAAPCNALKVYCREHRYSHWGKDIALLILQEAQSCCPCPGPWRKVLVNITARSSTVAERPREWRDASCRCIFR